MLKPHQISIETVVLKDRLTAAYSTMRSRGQSMLAVKHFDDLWDIKEQALLEKKASVMIPSGCLNTLYEQAKTPETVH